MSPIRRALSLFALMYAVLMCCTGASSDSLKRTDLVNCALRIQYERMEGGSLITGHGTAFGVDLSPYGQSSRRLMLSAAHNVLDEKGRPYDTLKIEIKEGPREYWSKVRVVASDPEMDVCLVEAGEDLPFIATLDTSDLQAGARVVLAGSPRGIPVATYDGEVMRRFDSGTIRTAARIAFDHGDSGGPFFNASNLKVIGVAVAGVPKNGDLDHTIGLFVPLVGIDSFLQSNLPKFRGNKMPVVASRSVIRPAPVKPETEGEVVIDAPTRTVVQEPVSDVAEVIDLNDPASKASAIIREKVVPVPAPAPKVVEKKRDIPAPTLEVEAAAPAVAKIEKKREAPAPSLEVAPQPKPVTAKIPTPERTISDKYMVQPGDSLGKIAKCHNCTLADLLSANNIKDPNYIQVGMKLTIPSNK